MSNNFDLNKITNFAESLADLASTVTLSYFRNPQIIETKSEQVSNMASIADIEAENAMVERIKQECPEYGVIREEGDNIESKNGYHWVLDPIDGSSSFLLGRPIWGTLIALVDADYCPVLGIIDQPFNKERWIGIKDKPTTLNGQVVEANQLFDLSQTIVSKTTPHMFCTDRQQETLRKVEELCGSKSIWGGDCYNYACLASTFSPPGVVIESDMQYYDYAALIPIIEGAKGKITNWQGNALKPSDTEVLATSNVQLHNKIIETIA